MRFYVKRLSLIGRSDFHVKILNERHENGIELHDIESYINELKRNRDHELSSIRTFCIDLRTAYVQGLGERYDIDIHLKAEIRRVFKRITPRNVTHRVRPLITLNEWRAIVGGGNPKYRSAAKLLGFTALRVSEACTIRNRDIRDMGNGDCSVYVYGKGSKARYIPIPTEMINNIRKTWSSAGEKYLLAAADGVHERLKRQSLAWKLRLHSQRMIGRVTSPHDYRAFFATHAYEESPESLKEIMQLMGLSSVEVFMRHYKKLRNPLNQRTFKFLKAAG